MALKPSDPSWAREICQLNQALLRIIVPVEVLWDFVEGAFDHDSGCDGDHHVSDDEESPVIVM